MRFTVGVQVLEDIVSNRDSGSERELYNHYGGPEGLAQNLQTDIADGLDEKDMQTNFSFRIEEYGTNKIPEKSPRSFFSFFFGAIQDRTLIILMVAAIVSIGLGVGFPPPNESRSTAWIEGTAILIAVFLVSSVTAGNDFSKDRRFRQLSTLSDDRRVKVIRGGRQVVISINDVLVGDVVSLETGDFIPADMIYIKGQSLHADESAMTGEPEAVLKNHDNPFLLSGCMITEGVGKGIVIATGIHSQWGKIKVNLEKPETKTPLQEKLEGLAENIGKGGLLAAIITFAALIFRWAIETVGIKEQRWKWSELGTLVRFIITSITIIVVAVPEGLPLAVTLSLAYSMIKMMKDQNLVRHLAACETMGGATNICSDKTGTLTQNRMTVVRLFVGDQRINEPPKASHTPKIHAIPLQLLNEGICINSSAEIENPYSEKPNFIGAKTECALLVMSANLGTEYEIIRKELEIEKLYPFSSKKKSMSTIVRNDKGFRCFTKGASEVILEQCTETYDTRGEKKPLTSAKKKELLKTINDWASQGFRTLTMAYVDLPLESHIPTDGECPFEKNLVLVGIVGIEDPLRPEVPNSVAQCIRAGITVRMLTGDNLLTAKKIAKECGILTDGVAIEGPEFRKLTTDRMDLLIPRLQVIARCSPDDKLALVSRLRELGEVVAVTGDGTNDAPALREADVGFAMGISGTEVAKDASDIILLDDNFSSIEKAVLWGRGVYDSIRKFLQFQLTVNVVAVVVAMVGAISNGDSPLKPVQLLWVNLIMDTMAALALATEAPTPELLNRPPHGRHSPLITHKMWRMILGQAVWQFGVLFYLLYGIQTLRFLDCSQSEHDNELKSTIIFNAFVWSQFFNEINTRKLGDEKNVFKGLLKSYIFLGVLVFTAVVQVIIIEFGGYFTKTVGLNWKQWSFCLVVGVMSLPLGVLIRCIHMPDEKTNRITQHPGAEEAYPLLGKVDYDRKCEEIETANDRLELTVFGGFEPRLPSGYWEVAKRVLTQIKVVSAFRKVTPGQRF